MGGVSPTPLMPLSGESLSPVLPRVSAVAVTEAQVAADAVDDAADEAMAVTVPLIVPLIPALVVVALAVRCGWGCGGGGGRRDGLDRGGWSDRRGRVLVAQDGRFLLG